VPDQIKIGSGNYMNANEIKIPNRNFLNFNLLTGSVFLVLLCSTLPAQVDIQLPSELQLYVNESEFIPTEAWTDSLIEEAENAYIRYEIVTTFRSLSAVTTRIRIPQFYTLPEVIRQVVLYYALLNNENERTNETLFIYPFFKNINDPPLIICTYESTGNIEVTVMSWPTVPRPGKPVPEHRFIYNQLIEADLSDLNSRDTIADEVYEKIAGENNISVDELEKIYQSVKLWQLSQ
jgi:hypothetical protein